jgi:hypothetical protein
MVLPGTPPWAKAAPAETIITTRISAFRILKTFSGVDPKPRAANTPIR